MCAKTEPFELDAAFANEFAVEWIAAWNEHDLAKVLSHYNEEIEFSSPFVIARGVDPSGTVRGKQALAGYWGPALTPDSTLHFELKNVLVGVNTLAIVYRTNAGGQEREAAEVFQFDASGSVYRAFANYSDSLTP